MTDLLRVLSYLPAGLLVYALLVRIAVSLYNFLPHFVSSHSLFFRDFALLTAELIGLAIVLYLLRYRSVFFIRRCLIR